MLNIRIKTIPDSEQRYDTSGDYETLTDGTLEIRVSEFENEDYEFLISVHELIEAYLCKKRGISEDDIDSFDMNYESNRLSNDTVSEPGDQPSAPYHREHVFAIKVEQMVAEELGVDWDEYTKSWQNLTGNNKNP